MEWLEKLSKEEPPARVQELRSTLRVLQDPTESGQELVSRVSKAIAKTWSQPIEANNLRLRLEGDLTHGELPRPDDYEGITNALKSGKTWGVNLYGTFVVEDTRTGEVVDRKKINLAKIPVPTFNRSFVVDGKSRYLQHLERRIPGVFTRRNEAGDLVTEFNLEQATSSRIKSFDIRFDQSSNPDNPDFKLTYGSSESLPVWDLAKLLGASEKDLKNAVDLKTAQSLISQGTADRYEKTLRKFYPKVFRGKEDEAKKLPLREIETRLRDQFATSQIDPRLSKVTLGLDSDRVDAKTILASFKRLTEVANGEPEDDRESFAVKAVFSPTDLLTEAVGRESTQSEYIKAVHGRLRRLSDRNEPGLVKVDQLIGNPFHKLIKQRLALSLVQRADDSTTPLNNISLATTTSIIGEGAIRSDVAIPADAKLLNTGAVGFKDLVHTPENSRAGVILHLTSRSKVVFDPSTANERSTGHSKVVAEFLTPSGKKVDVTPYEAKDKHVIPFSQYTKDSFGKIRFKTDESGKIQAWRNGDLVRIKPSEADYLTIDSASIYDPNTGLVPFGNSVQGGRLGYFNKQSTQSVPLKSREVPLVQTRLPGAKYTNEQLLAVEAGARFSPVDGVVENVYETGQSGRYIEIRPNGAKKTVKVSLPRNYPMGGQVPLDSTPVVKPGQEIKKGDLLADSNFTKDGTLAFGINARTAYLPYHTSTFEDAITISESARQRFTSEHLYNEETHQTNIRLGKGLYGRHLAIPLPKDAINKLDEDGVIKVGQKIDPNELLLVGLQHEDLTNKEVSAKAAKLGLYKSLDKRGMRKGARFFEKRWNSSYPGEVIDVTKIKDKDGNITGAKVQIRTLEPLEIGDKIYGRHANKGVVSAILPDNEMPRNSKGEHVEVLYNPGAVTGRINPSQNFETFLGKVARKNGQVEVVENYGYPSNFDYVKQKLREAGVEGGEDLIDPRTGKRLENVGVGIQYILKAKHQVDHKTAGRGVGSFQESGLASKGEEGAQSLGELGMFSLLAHNARANIRDALLYKSENNPEVWEALSSGRPLPPAKVPGAFVRFRNYLQAAGIDLEQNTEKGQFRMKPLTDSDVLRITRTFGKDNVISDPVETIRAKNDEPIKGGLFDPEATGGRGGAKWARFTLSSKIPNPMYESAIRDVLGLPKRRFENIMAGIEGVKSDNGDLFGPAAIEHMLSRVDLQQVRAKAYQIASSPSEKDSSRNGAHRTLKTLDMLERNKIKPQDAFLRKEVLVLPASMREIKVDTKTGDYIIGDLNYLYRDLAMVDAELKKAREKKMPPRIISQLESHLYDTMRSLMQSEGSAPQSSGDYQGLTGILIGARPSSAEGKDVSDVRDSFLKDQIINKRLAFTGRTVLTPRDDLDLDEVAIPRQIAVAIFEPQIEAAWKKRNPYWQESPSSTSKFRKFREEIHRYKSENKPSADVNRVLDEFIKDRHVAVKRDPALHQYSIQGLRPKLTDDKTISLNPLIYSGYGADNDGDTLAIYAPVSESANRELAERMNPKNNLFMRSSGKLAYQLSHEAILGLNRITRDPVDLSPKMSFASLKEAKQAFLANKIKATDSIKIAGSVTTFGKASVDEALPDGVTLEGLVRDGILSSKYGEIGLDKKNIASAMTHLAKTKPDSYSFAANNLRKLGQTMATLTGTSLILDDFEPVLVEERKQAKRKLLDLTDSINSDKSLSDADRQKRLRSIYDEVLGTLDEQGKKVMRASMFNQRANVNAEMTFSDARVKPVQLKQVLQAPGAVLDGKGRVIGTPVLTSYSEGLPIEEHYATFHGARMGTVSKVIEVQDPGFLTKQLVATSMDQVVSTEDCKTKRGIWVDALSSGDDIEGRVLASNTTLGGKLFSSGSLLDGNALSVIRSKAGTEGAKLFVRSPLTCEAKEGVCQKCVGALPNGKMMGIGSNFGVVASQSIGERSTQLTLSTFHAGGVYEPGNKGGAKNLFHAASSLLRMPSTMGGDKALLSPASGQITSVMRNKGKGGWDLMVDDGAQTHKVFVPSNRQTPTGEDHESYYRGRKVTRGELLTEGIANPKELLEVTQDMDHVRNYMAQRLGKLFSKEGVLTRNAEGVIRALTNTVEVQSPGKTGLVPGARISEVEAKEHASLDRGFRYRPILKGVDVAPREYRDDVFARLGFNNLGKALREGAQTGGVAKYHGFHPIPAMAYGVEFDRDGLMSGRPRTDGRY